MKKIILTFLLCGGMVLGISGCEKTKNEFKTGEESDIQIKENDVTLTIKNGTLDNTGATFVLTNNSNKLLIYDEEFEIEIKQNNKWHKIDVELSFTQPIWELEPKEAKELKINWKNGYGKLAKGEYRIIKGAYFEEDIEHKFYVSAEFKID